MIAYDVMYVEPVTDEMSSGKVRRTVIIVSMRLMNVIISSGD